MFSFVLAFQFLYFPEDKTAYIPAVITLVIFSFFAYVAFTIFRKISKREEKKAKELEEQVKNIHAWKEQLEGKLFFFYVQKSLILDGFV